MRHLLATTLLLSLCAGARADEIERVKNANEPIAGFNTIGYRPESRKLATLSRKADRFVILDTQTRVIVLEGQASRINGSSPGQPLYEIDFSDVRTEGAYRIEVDGQRLSEFRVAKDIYNWPFYCVSRAMYLWRCGTKVSARLGNDLFEHEACHLHDARLDLVNGENEKRKDGTGGWHDAGDYNKYPVNAAFTLGMMLSAWEHFPQNLVRLKLDIPESQNETPDLLDEVRWELDWLLKMQADDGRIYHMLSTKQYGQFISPENDKELRFFSPWSSAATAAFTAIMAKSARIYEQHDKPFAAECLAAARKSYKLLQSHPDDHRPNLTAFAMAPYVAPDPDDRLWAAAELWETTGDSNVLADFEARLSAKPVNSRAPKSVVDSDWDWSNARNLGVFTYVLSSRAGRDPTLVARTRDDTVQVADSIVEKAKRHPYARTLGERYYWGCNGTVARQAINLHIAHRLSGDQRYRDTILDSLNHLFGRNVHGRSYVTGLGAHPPLFPHDRRSGGDKTKSPWPGYLVGGPWPKAIDWKDEEASYQTNEIAINWNGALIYALAAFVEPESFETSKSLALNKASQPAPAR
jgi:endoglucanase